MNKGKNVSEIHPVHLAQIDLLKGMAMVSVILLHTIPTYLLLQSYSQFHIWQAVPIFFILMGFTSMISFSSKKFLDIKSFYWKNYLFERFQRVFVPFVFTFCISFLYGIIHNVTFLFKFDHLIGLFPVSGPGNYFVSILFQYVLIAPFIYVFYQKAPKYCIVTLFAIDVLFQLIVPYIPIFYSDPYLYSASILRYFSAIALGFYISDDFMKNGNIELNLQKNRFILIGLYFSMIYLFSSRFLFQPFPLFLDSWGSQNVLSFFYPLVIVIFIVNTKFDKYENNSIFKFFQKIGKASYHIFLVQILFFGFESLIPYPLLL